jgi:CheY-like chemotaxis protein
MSDLKTMTHESAGRLDNDVAVVDEPTDATILIVEHDADCADALTTLLSNLPGIAAVRTTATATDAFELLDRDTDDVVGFGMLSASTRPSTPDIVFIASDQPDTGANTIQLLDTLTTFRGRLPDATIVLLCVYHDQCRTVLGGLADGCIRKDTNARELSFLIEELRAARSA